MHTHTEQPSSENDRRTRTRPTDRPTDRADSRASATRPGRAEEAREPPDRKRVAWTMPEDIITYVCSDLSTNAPKAEAGLRDQACDRILGRYIQDEALERVRDDPEDLLACLRECITLDNEQLAKAKEALGKLAPPAAALTLGGNANTLPKREWAEVKKLGTNRQTALALFGLDLRDRVSEVAQRYGLAWTQERRRARESHALCLRNHMQVSAPARGDQRRSRL